MLQKLKQMQKENIVEFDLALKLMGYEKNDSGEGYFTDEDMRRLLINLQINPMNGRWIGFINQLAKHYGKAETMYALDQTVKHTTKPSEAYVTAILEKRRTKNEAEATRLKAEQEKKQFEKEYNPELTKNIFTEALKTISTKVPENNDEEKRRLKKENWERNLKAGLL